MKHYATTMRRAATDAEQKLWSLLRNRRLGRLKFRRQVPVAGYIADFYCIEKRLVVELDGGQHNEPDQRAADEQRTRDLRDHGIDVIRFWDHEVLKYPDAVARTIYRHLTTLERPSPQPSPGVPGEGAEAGGRTTENP